MDCCASAAFSLFRSKKQRSLRLIYLDIKGLAEPIRLVFAVGGVPFEDVRVSYEEVAAMRAAGRLPFGQVPVLEIDGVTYGQSVALLRWAGRQSGLYPNGLELKIDSVLEAIADVNKQLGPQWYKNALGRHPTSGALLESTKLTPTLEVAVQNGLINDILPGRLAFLERCLQESDGPFCCGSQLTIADIQLYAMLTGILDGTYCEGVPASVLDACPRLRTLVKHVDNHPRVSEWNAQRVSKRAS
eukprot:TRINITY_DN47043_c0_g1_i1.p1 TRINITY_DN47043_c0_g1~~TRINITY_DN47043_c0_g1_i1.p1  ORF type:complete len:244 (-),score=29.76 TRINITY_DN47043_c0_g1_i1:68-799(-)